MPEIIRTCAALRDTVARWQRAGLSVGFVPTMGALHQGHLSLARAARTGSDRVIVSIFVNPKQFNNPDDLRHYPRREADDLALLATEGINVIFAPGIGEVYPDGFATTVAVAGPSGPLEGACRPGHFNGVATVVAKLFAMTRADLAFFGEKDWQQVQVIRRMVTDLNLAVRIIACPTVREADGLAMSSRNIRLAPQDRSRAPVLHAAMQAAGTAIRAGTPVATALLEARATILAVGFRAVEYLDLCDAENLAPLAGPGQSARLLAAAWLGDVRLIDNIAL